MNESFLNKIDERIEIVYIARDGAFTQRKVKIISTNENEVYGYCYMRKQVRRFTKDNILAAYPCKIQH